MNMKWGGDCFTTTNPIMALEQDTALQARLLGVVHATETV